jgi:hypothetical protein
LQRLSPTAEFEVTDRKASAANRALELIGKELGMFKEKFEPPGIGAGPVIIVTGVPRPQDRPCQIDHAADEADR